MSGATQRAPDLDEGEVEVVLNSSQQAIKAPAVLQPIDQSRTVEQADHSSRNSNGLSSSCLWALFALGWFFPPLWWVAAAAGLQAGGDAQSLIQRRRRQSRPQTAAWRASVVMTAVSAAVLVLALPIYYGRPTVPRAGPFYMTLSGPPESFPDLNNPAKRQMLVRAVHASLDLPSSYPLANIQLWIQTETSVAAAPTRHLLFSNKVFVLGYTLIQTTELPSTPELQATLASPAAVEAIAQSLEQDGFIAPEHAGSVFVGLSTAGPDEIVNQIAASSPTAGGNSTNLGQPAVAQFVPIGRRNCQGGWSAWSVCSAACGGGISTRSYAVTVTARAGGRDCPVADGATETEQCNTEACPLPCIGSPTYPGTQYAAWGCAEAGTAHAGTCAGTCIGDSAGTSATCNNGTYIADTDCVAVCLYAPPAISNGSLVCSNTTAAGSNCTGVCNTGFRGTPTVTCETDGSWSDVGGSCELIVCPDSPPAPANATFDCGSSSLPNTTCNATCEVGYRGAASATCQKDGTWSAVDGGCSLIVCAAAPPVPAEGTFSCSADTLPGSNCTATCSTGYRGAPIVACQQDGLWGDVEGDCELIVCSDNPPAPANATFDCGASSLLNTTCNATCEVGYRGAASAVCREDGTWSAVDGGCSLIVCPDSPPAAANATFDCGASSLPNTTCDATCEVGYRGSASRTCQEDGTWSAVDGGCSLIVCSGSPPAPANATFDCGSSRAVNTRCDATCDTDFCGTPYSVCQPDGTWAPVSGGCEPTVATEQQLLLAAGKQHTCVTIPENGTVRCVGDTSSVPTARNNSCGVPVRWAAWSAGDKFTCGIETEASGSRLRCWGTKTAAYMAGGDAGEGWAAVSAQNAGVCALKAASRRMSCWGTPGVHPTLPASTAWAAVGVGSTHACGILADTEQNPGAMVCWGGNSYGQTNVPRASDNSTLQWSAVAAGLEFTCGIVSGSRSLLCWGDNAGDQGWKLDKVPSSSLEWTTVSAGWYHACGIRYNATSAGALQCWGGGGTAINVPSGIDEWRSPSGGWWHSCGIRADTNAALCWCNGGGGGGSGQCNIPRA